MSSQASHRRLTASRLAPRHQEVSVSSLYQHRRYRSRIDCADLALEELQASATASADVAKLVLSAVVGHNSSGIATTDNNSRTTLRRLDVGIEKGLR